MTVALAPHSPTPMRTDDAYVVGVAVTIVVTGILAVGLVALAY